jgi:hypothetical protein
MHPSALSSALTFFDEYVDKPDARVLELGSASIDGSIRDHLPNSLQWTGVDLEPGPGVDVVLADPYELPFASKSFDVSVSTSVFEHNEMFWLSFLELVRITTDGGLIYLCSPSNGKIHRYPLDCYRFYPDAGFALQNWARRNNYAVTLVESLVLRKDGSEWNDWVAVFTIGNDEERFQIQPRLASRFTPQSVGHGTSGFAIEQIEATEDQLDLHTARQRISELEATE